MSAMAWLGALLVIASMMLRDPRWFRSVNLAAALVLIIVNAALGITAMVGLNVVIAIVDVHHLRRMRREPALTHA